MDNRNSLPLQESSFILVREKERELLDVNEFIHLLSVCGVSDEIKTLAINTMKALKKNQVMEKSLNKAIIMNRLLDYNTAKKGIVYDYIFFNMVFGGLPIDRKFIEERVYKNRRRDKVFRLYDYYKPDYLPNMDINLHDRLKLFLATIWVFYNSDNLDDEIVLVELKNHLGGSRMFAYWGLKKPLIEVTKEFIEYLAPFLIKNGFLDKRENQLDYLYTHLHGQKTSLSKEDGIWAKFEEKMTPYKNSEFYSTFYHYVKEKMDKKTLNIVSLDKYITYWSRLVHITVAEGGTNIRAINSKIRDTYIWEYGENSSLRADMDCFRNVLKFYNEQTFEENYKEYFDISIFSQDHLAKRSFDAKHNSFMDEAEDALIASIGSELLKTSSSFEKLNTRKKQIFFLSRIIWLKLLTGARISEILDLDLDKIKSSISYKTPYIMITTLKDNPDREFILERGKPLEKGNFELDCIHVDIINQTIEAAEKMYLGIKIKKDKKRYLFPSETLTEISYDSVKYYFKNVQERNAIICGSHYDIMSRDVYESIPDMKLKLENRRALFSLHEIRDMFINRLLLHGMTNAYEIRDEVGHGAVESQETYKQAPHGMMQVANFMEENGHYGAQNKLISPLSFKVESGVDRKDIVLAPKVENYLNELENSNSEIYNVLTIPYDQASNFIDTKTICETRLSCGDTGFGCLGCKSFVSGTATHDALLNVGAILAHQFKTIDYEINRLNEKRLYKKSTFEIFQRLLKSILVRFEGIQLAKERTLTNPNNFSWDEGKADKYILNISKRVRKSDFCKEVVSYINDLIKRKKLDEYIILRLHLLTSKTNRKVFK
ncbi:hypothetical protein [Bacillus sp. PS06]|uniref:hypothetical protein n=1 Tax=Bacillus sp. PS06 TaxID=2764176 RepID=UPI001786A661|nr:hypothetical protein [Bacillus sp. PS06]MBD8069301.1 hypothetical protein [Bacillus sp. PS06]